MKKAPLPRKDRGLWQSPAWYQALFLTERRPQGQLYPQDLLTQQENDRARALRLWQTWKAQPPFNHGSFFAERLASDALTDECCLALLAEPVEQVKARLASSPDWLTTLRGAFAETDTYDEAWPLLQEVLADHPLGSYMQAIRPLLLHGFSALLRKVQVLRQHYPDLPFDCQYICQVALSNILPELFTQMSKAIVLEMHVARLQNRLHGEKPEERFHDFIHQLDQEEGILPLLAEYPVLARLLVSTIEAEVDFSAELLAHLCADWSEICTLFVPEGSPGFLVDMQSGVGDVHRRGRSVQILRFESGLQLVYKPKSLAVDKHFQELLAWLNERGATPPFRLLEVLDRGDYGWSEYVEAASCSSEEEVARFYERQGGYLALLYVLNAVDFHIENVIASGEDPMLVDLEALFHPSIADSAAMSSEDILSRAMEQSVLRVGLLPQWLWSNEHSQGIDISGLGGLPGQKMPRPVPEWQEGKTDQMRLVRQDAELPASQNRVQLNNAAVDVLDYSDSIVTGFTRIYRLLMQLREPLLAEKLPCFAHDEVRVIMRATSIYGTFLTEASHPDLLRDALERDCFFDRLWQEVEHNPLFARFVPFEKRDLLRGDIPLFTTFPDSRTIFTSEREPLENVFGSSGMELVQRQLRQLDEHDLARQVWSIRASLATLRMASEEQIEMALPPRPAQRPISREHGIELATHIGIRLEELALWDDTGAWWLSVHPVHERAWGLLPVDTGLYSGASGMAFFLGYLGALTGDARFTSLARLALASITQQIEQQRENLLTNNVGAFDGLGSLIYLFTHLGVLWGEPELIFKAEELVELLPALISRDDHLDIVSGSAGCILSLLSLYAIRPSPSTLEKALQCGDHLLARACPMYEGCGWLAAGQEWPLSGFSHGNAGIALSLLQLVDCSGEQRFRQTALDALAYERSLFLPSQQNWADLRAVPAFAAEAMPPAKIASVAQQQPMVAWCHGAAGIGLGRLGLLQYLDEAKLREEIDIALRTTMRQGLTGNQSLCHGALGNTELFLVASQILNRPEDHQRLEETLSLVLGGIEAYGWLSCAPLGVETPDLMIGLAGMGYELLRLADADRVPSLLLVAPPCATNSA